jgi:hypothetical protein
MVSPSAADIAASEPASGADRTRSKASADDGLRPDHAETAARAGSLVPPYFQRPFVGFTSALALLFGGGWITLHRRERKAGDIQRERERARSQMTHALLEAMTAASARGDAAAFFAGARSALQQSLGARWQLPADQITMADVDAHLDGADADDVRQILALADESNYSAGLLQAADFERWTELVRRQLALEDPR